MSREGNCEHSDALLRSAGKRLTGLQHRLFIAEVTLVLCNGNPRSAERRFGWGRETIEKGLEEQRSGVPSQENYAARGRPRWEDEDPQRAADIRAIVEPHTQADPELKTTRRYTNLSERDTPASTQTRFALPRQQSRRYAGGEPTAALDPNRSCAGARPAFLTRDPSGTVPNIARRSRLERS